MLRVEPLFLVGLVVLVALVCCALGVLTLLGVLVHVKVTFADFFVRLRAVIVERSTFYQTDAIIHKTVYMRHELKCSTTAIEIYQTMPELTKVIQMRQSTRMSWKMWRTPWVAG
eukprot:2760984-Amphidinium_carterae.1